MALFTTDIDLKGDPSKVESYLLRLKRDLEYMFSHLNPEDNFDEDAKLLYVANQERQSAIEIALDHITLEMVNKDNIVAAINLSDEGVKIQGEKLSLEGVTTFNNNVVIGLDGTIHANNGEFSGYIAASDISGSNITGSKITAGGSDDSSITVYDKDGNPVAILNKLGVDVRAGSIKGANVEVGGTNNTNGTLIVRNASGAAVVTLNNGGISIINGALSVTGGGSISGSRINGGEINGTDINLGGNGTAGTLTVKDNSGNPIGVWSKTGITLTGRTGAPTTINAGTINSGTINGSDINVGGSGYDGSITVKDASGNTLATMDKVYGLRVYKGSISGTSLELGGLNNTYGTLTIKNASGTPIGVWDNDGINISSGEIHVGQFYTDGDYTSIGPFQVVNNSLLENYYCLATEDMSVGISSDPDENSNHWIWAGWDGQGGSEHFDFYVERGGDVYAHDFCVIGMTGTTTLVEAINSIGLLEDDVDELFRRVGTIEDELGL